MKEKISLFFYKVLIVITLFFFLIILYNSLLKVDVASYIADVMDNPHIIYWLGSFILLIFFLALSKMIDKSSDKSKLVIKVIFVTLMLVSQLIIILKLDVNQITDSSQTLIQALSIAENLENGLSINFYGYFYTHVNNDLFLIVNVFLVKIYELVKFISLNRFLAIANTFMIDLSVFVVYKLGKKIKNENFGLKILILNVMNPLNYLLIYWSYTCTYSTVFVVLALLIGLYVVDKNSTIIRKTLLYSLLGFVFIFGYYLRPIILIPIIALILYVIFRNNKSQVGLKKIVMMFCCVLSFTCLSYNIISYGLNKLDRDTSQSFPITHYIMMGLHDNGTHNDYDPSFTLSYTSQKEKIDANINEIINTLKSYGISGLIKHFYIKLPITWSDGTAGYSSRLTDDKELSSFYTWFVGAKSDFIKVYSQCFRIATLILGVVCLIDKLKYKKFENNSEFLIILTLFGAVLFYLIWEAKDVYSLPFIPVLLILSCLGLEKIADNKVQKKINYKIIRNITLLVTLLLSVSLYSDFVNKKISYKDYSLANINMVNQTSIDDIASSNKTIEQTFYAKKSFNKIQIHANKILEKSDTKYVVEVKKENEIVASSVVTTDRDFINYVTITLDEQEKGTYSIIIYVEDNSEDSIKWFCKDGIYYEYYDGDLIIDGELDTADLAISVYYSYESSFMSKKLYLFLTLLLVLFEIWLFYKINRLYVKNIEN